MHNALRITGPRGAFPVCSDASLEVPSTFRPQPLAELNKCGRLDIGPSELSKAIAHSEIGR